MGLVSGLLGLPMAPVRAASAAAEKVRRQAEEAYYDPAAIRAELEEVDRLRELGRISDEDATAWEDQLIDRMLEAQRRRGR